MCICYVQHRPAHYSHGKAGKGERRTSMEDLDTTINTCFQLKPTEPISLCKTNWKVKKFCSRLRNRVPVLPGGRLGTILMKMPFRRKRVICLCGSQKIAAKMPSVPKLSVSCWPRRGMQPHWGDRPPWRSYPVSTAEEATVQWNRGHTGSRQQCPSNGGQSFFWLMLKTHEGTDF